MTYLSPTVHTKNLFETLFNPTWFSALESSANNALTLQTSYPYNIKSVWDEDDKLQKILIEFALAGFDKSELDVKIVDDELQILTKHNPPEDDPKTTFNHHGISKRDMKVVFKLGSKVNKTNIASTFKNGLLVIEIPTKVDETKVITIA